MRPHWVLLAASALLTSAPAASALAFDGLDSNLLRSGESSPDESCGLVLPAGADQGRLWVCSNGSKQYLSCFDLEPINCPIDLIGVRVRTEGVAAIE